jgi:3-deoxy-D-manno-octulosonic acid kinase
MDWQQRWGRDPALEAFVPLSLGAARVLVRRGYEEAVRAIGLPDEVLRVEGYAGGGRERHPLVTLAEGERALVRRYRRGGLLGRVNRSLYLVGHRALAELRVTEIARSRAVHVPIVLCALERPARVGYTAWLVVRWIEGARDLASWLQEMPEAVHGAGLRAAGAEIGRMHAAGIGHADLNLRNVLMVGGVESISTGGSAPAIGNDRSPGTGGTGLAAPLVFIVDLDRAKDFEAGVPALRRRREIRRFSRSARRLGAPIGREGWEALRDGYGPGWPLD